MAEYIEREALKESIYKMANSDFLFIDAVVDEIDNAPAADVVEVVHGRWELYPSDFYRRCSVCKREFDKPRFNVRAKYCPHCGARMDGVE